MPTIHFLNVKEGDCSVVKHASGHVTVIDVSNAKPVDHVEEASLRALAKSDRGVARNFRQKEYPVNPVGYLHEHDIWSVFRYVQTHPDMDHMDGIEAFFEAFEPTNFWDTDNEEEKEFGPGAPYNEDDWLFYKKLRDSNRKSDPKRLTLDPSSRGEFYNRPDGGDGLYVLAPTEELVDQANETGDYNQVSYVVLYSAAGGHRIVFGGDSHDDTWDYILENHEEDVTDIDLLIAPHHGRKSGRSYKFLDTLNPTLTFFGNARHEHLAYEAWNRRGLQKVTNNQANCMVVDVAASPMDLYVTHENFAKVVNPNTWYSSTFKAYYVGPITEDLLPC